MNDDDQITFHCNICDATSTRRRRELTREDPTCDGCRSTVRMRSIIQVLSRELFGESIPISQFGQRQDIKGIGMSCWVGYAAPLAEHLDFTNTYYHMEPRLDITDVPDAMAGTLDFVTSTDVFEHVAPPVDRAFSNVRKILKSDGVFVFSVPHYGEKGKRRPTCEHFPDLFDYEITEIEGRRQLRNTTVSGERQVFDGLVFHGGEGTTLEMRVFSQRSALRELASAGFNDVTIYSEPEYRHGIAWQNRNSLTMAARTITGMYRKLTPWQRVRFV